MSTTPSILEARGKTGKIVFDGQFVELRRTGRGRTTVGKGSKRIPVRSITAVQWKPAGMFVSGFMQFTIPGGNERTSRPGKATVAAAQDENSIVFGKRQMSEFETIRNAIERAMVGEPA